MEDKLLYQQKSALVFTEVSIAVDIKVLVEDVTTATFVVLGFQILKIRTPAVRSTWYMSNERTEIVTHRWSFNRRIFVKMKGSDLVNQQMIIMNLFWMSLFV